MSINIIQLLLSGLTDNSGEPLASGKVYSYEAGGAVAKDTYTDSLGATPEANPIILDSNGRKQVYAGSGSYRLVVKTSADATLYDWDNLNFGTTLDTYDFLSNELVNVANGTARTSAANLGQVQNGAALHGGTSTGAANTYAITLSPAITAYAEGQSFTFISHQANTGAVTLNVNGLGAKAIKKWDGATALGVNDIVSGQAVACVYTGTNFQLLSPSVFGNWASWTPTLSAVAPLTLGSTAVTYAKYIQIGKIIFFQLLFTGTAGGTSGPIITFTVPVTAAGTSGTMFPSIVSENGAAGIAGAASLASVTTAHVYKYNAANYTSGYTESISVMGFYEAA